jgi:parvulin-like peptidyl-prolyl isomerase
VIGGSVITRRELTIRQNIVQFSYDLKARGTPQYDPQFARKLSGDVLEQLIDEHVLLAGAPEVTSEETSTYVGSLMEWLQKDAYRDNEQAFAAELKARGLTLPDWEGYFAANLRLVHLQEKVTAGVTASDEESQTFYDRNPGLFVVPEMRRVFIIRTDEQDSAEAALRRLAAGEAFTTVASEVSMDQTTRGLGGDMGFVPPGALVPALDNAALLLEAGQTSGVVSTVSGFYILRVKEVVSSRQETFAEAIEEARQQMIEEKRGLQWATYVKNARRGRIILRFWRS